ncbi:MAG: hypothetical protein D3915_05965 [Candidatus Electrothrix sp. AU1_5]|nr:hypothetical protein [Candidatus Electrothrix gigas]
MPSFYRCENEFGDPCTFALENRKIPAEEALPNMDGGQPKCPGKTQSGKDCGRELIPIKEKSFPRVPLIIAGGILGGIALVWFVVVPMLQEKPDPSPSPVVVSNTVEERVPVPPRHNQEPRPQESTKPNITETSESIDPWWVYQQLETTSTILLRTEP